MPFWLALKQCWLFKPKKCFKFLFKKLGSQPK